MGILVPFSLILSLCCLCSGMKDIKVAFGDDGYTFEVDIAGEQWFRSGGGFVGVWHQGIWWSNDQEDTYFLKLMHIEDPVIGSDSIGQYEGTRYTWRAYTDSETPAEAVIETAIYVYLNVPVVSFDVTYVTGLNNDLSDDEEVTVVSAFPSFVVEEGDVKRGWMTWSGNMASKMKFGKWSKDEAIYGDVDGGLPLVVFDSEMKTAVVLSPLTSFMTATQDSFSIEKTNETMLTFGPLNTLNEVPAGYRYKTLLVAGDNVTSAMQLYGEILMKYYGKDHSYRKSDYSINYLGYWTDNGACYYYYHGNYSNYEDLLVAVKKDADIKQLPYQYVQLDSWWYFKGMDGGVKNWTAMPEVFPNGIQSMQNKTGWSIVAHNRYWSADTDYRKKYNFSIEGSGAALPNDPKFWDYLISTSVDHWKLITYEQDWLDNEFGKMNALKRDIYLGERWLKQMSEAAKNHGVYIQYCMPWPRHVLQSVMNPAVTQLRVSGDYEPGNDQWIVGDSTLLSHFIGLAAFKDDFRSSTNQPDCAARYHSRSEPCPVLEAYTAALTGGPVAPSDMIGTSDTTLIMATCMKDGRLLKPTYPTMSLDTTFLRRTFDQVGPMGEMSAAYTQIEDFTWYFVKAAELEEDYHLSASELPPSPSTFPHSAFDAVVFQYNVVTGKPFSIEELTVDNTITIEKCGKCDFKYLVTAPRFYNGMYLFGELSKFVPVSEQRFVSIEQTEDQVYMRLSGVPTERVEITLYDGQAVKTVECVIRDDYYADLTIFESIIVCK